MFFQIEAAKKSLLVYLFLGTIINCSFFLLSITEGKIRFHATSHGKGSYNGLGGNLKRSVFFSTSKLQLPAYSAITTPVRFFDWVKGTLTENAVYCCCKEGICITNIKQRLFQKQHPRDRKIPRFSTNHLLVFSLCVIGLSGVVFTIFTNVYI